MSAHTSRATPPWSGPSDHDELELVAFIQIIRLRERFNRPSGGQWGILYDPFRRRWIGIRGKTGWLCAETPTALEQLINRA
ncbi:hypothetical protein E1264_03135 [Actinomadura sp. KC216]|uniref:hypothetical protein n=1 Tax=Actinomadura sp. KC216 TaxID=2530370 RepID=UPI0010482F1F|nr:hypothetical protein [Actinomadura sp. KC216]TDB91007.1 hypothetical protein E1264_03135 [Actinomadura sp. KC216]